MDFFAHQEQARRNTTKLVVLFALAVLGIVTAVYAVAVGVTATTEHAPGIGPQWWQPRLLLYVLAGVLLVVGGGSLYKVKQLGAGGHAVATLLGGRRIFPATDDAGEKQLFNVVEEVAIASGVPVPSVYVLDDEEGINAFAAGFAPGDAVIGVTRGCIDQLSRDELQGVIAHEFSHIMNGDMRLNIRLMGVLHGILCIGLAGYIVLRGGAYGGYRSRGNRDGRGTAAILALGVALVVIGYLGVFFAKLIQAAVSRQREFLADASAVQFTRNPQGIAGALRKIGGFRTGARLHAAQARAASHMFFGNALKAAWFGALATHPPLEERIRRIEGLRPEAAPAAPPRTTGVTAPGTAGFAGASHRASGLTPERLTQRTGRPTDEQLQRTRQFLAQLPLAVVGALHEPFNARALVYALLLDRDSDERTRQTERLKQMADEPTYYEAMTLAGDLAGLERRSRLALVDLALPALREMSPNQFQGFRRVVEMLVLSDQRVDLFEFTLRKILLRHLDSHYEQPAGRRIRYHSVKPLLEPCRLLLSRLAHAGATDARQAQEAFEAGMLMLPSDGYPRKLAELGACTFSALDRALAEVGAATPASKRWVLRACAETIAHDGIVEPDEADLLRAIAEALDCPIPPLDL